MEVKIMTSYENPTNIQDNEEITSPDEVVETEDSSLIKESILQSIKKLLGIHHDVTEFDVDIIVMINSAFNTLTQLGVGPEKGFTIKSDKETWTDFIQDNRLEMIKSYIFLKVKIIFDSSQLSSFILEVFKQEIRELEWRLNIQIDVPGAFDKEVQ